MKFKNYVTVFSQYIDEIAIKNKQVNAMWYPLSQVNFENTEIGIEKLVEYGFSDTWKTVSFDIRRVLYHLERYCRKLIDVVNIVDEFCDTPAMSISPFQLCKEVAFEFDSLILTFSKLISAENKALIKKYSGKNASKKIENIFPNRTDLRLYWRINLLRNRIAHSSIEKYNYNDKTCSKYMDFSSEPIFISSGSDFHISMKCSLIDSEQDHRIGMMIQEEIIDKNDRTTNVFDLLFPNSSAKGYNKNKPNVLYFGDISYDYFNSSISLVYDILIFIDNINNFYVNEILHKSMNKTSILNGQFVLDTETEGIKLTDIFKIDN